MQKLLRAHCRSWLGNLMVILNGEWRGEFPVFDSIFRHFLFTITIHHSPFTSRCATSSTEHRRLFPTRSKSDLALVMRRRADIVFYIKNRKPLPAFWRTHVRSFGWLIAHSPVNNFRPWLVGCSLPVFYFVFRRCASSFFTARVCQITG